MVYDLDERNYNEIENPKYILIWSLLNHTEVDIAEGQDIFLDNQCPVVNCYITSDKYLLEANYTNFEAIIFNISAIRNWDLELPIYRTKKQLYIFYSTKSSDSHPLCNKRLDNYFNLTWTYKLNSDIVSPFIEVRDFEDNLIAPKKYVKWNTSLHFNISFEAEKRIRHKRKAMIWIVDKCITRNNRFDFAKRLQSELRINFLDFDIFGCGMYECHYGSCTALIAKQYYFYFVAEDSDADDYVTEEILKAYDNYAVAVIMGVANYRSYIIKSPHIYKRFHDWRKYYTIKETRPLNGICDLCSYLNSQQETRVRTHFRKWWYNKPMENRCLPGGADSFKE
ncbi:unnamed protein product, partial [Leptidea sinapis]